MHFKFRLFDALRPISHFSVFQRVIKIKPKNLWTNRGHFCNLKGISDKKTFFFFPFGHPVKRGRVEGPREMRVYIFCIFKIIYMLFFDFIFNRLLVSPQKSRNGSWKQIVQTFCLERVKKLLILIARI